MRRSSPRAPRPPADIARQAELYSIDLNHGDWQHEPVDACPAFTRHRFVFYHRSPQPGVRTSFMAVLPRQGGPPTLVPLAGSITGDHADPATLPTTLAAFNRIWQDELHAHGASFPGLTWTGLVLCYIRISAGQPISILEHPGSPEPPPFRLADPISDAAVSFTTPDNRTRTVSVFFDHHGMLDQVSVSDSPSMKE